MKTDSNQATAAVSVHVRIACVAVLLLSMACSPADSSRGRPEPDSSNVQTSANAIESGHTDARTGAASDHSARSGLH